MSIIDALLRAGRIIRQLIGTPLRDWAEFAEQNPAAAARELELGAEWIQARSERRRKRGWDRLADRDESIARAFRRHAAKLRAETSPATCRAIAKELGRGDL